jgi:hypothetical protein
MQEFYIKGFSKSHGFVTATTLVDDEVLNFVFNNSTNTVRDLLIENTGEEVVYIRFSKNIVETITIDNGSTKRHSFDDETVGWALMPDRPIALSYCDYTNIGMKTASGTSTVQIMGVLDTNNNKA